ncbi:GNAT family N-acetyltransferase [Gandjariella thermophila]|uniref:GNAT family N-acetyltransferase n=1 Tax=Gandjariella thermophila TaxID=1931992 RepID=A0A4D4J8U5_9PSEU|nr:GNAT family N-acetyltransferase [Gandjariella thermophila]GDY31088.1 GNAT family N-acetyltransferase [Gandjariella thermophila]
MTVGQELVDAQSVRFASVDPLLPPAAPPPDGDVITAALPDGRRVAGVLVRQFYGPGSVPSLWSARESWELTPLIGEHGGGALDALLRAWRQRMDRTGAPGHDSACVVTWPSRDVEATRVLLDHGFVPLSVIAVRRSAPPASEPPPLVSLRRAGPRDLETVLQLSLLELRYSALVGGTVPREDAVTLKRGTVQERLLAGEPTWLAERDGIAVGMVECGWTESAPGTWMAARLPHGRWGYVNCVSVVTGARGGGVGQQLMAVVHRELHRGGVIGTYLYYNPANPLSSVFWPRQGYRPLWTIWEVRPAGALR